MAGARQELSVSWEGAWKKQGRSTARTGQKLELGRSSAVVCPLAVHIPNDKKLVGFYWLVQSFKKYP